MELKPIQTEIVKECLSKKSGGLSLPLGFGKTIISLTTALQQVDDGEKILVVVSKTLLCSWINELEKFFPLTEEKKVKDESKEKVKGKSTRYLNIKKEPKNLGIKYEVVSSEYLRDLSLWKPSKHTKLVFVTPNLVGKTYKEFLIEDLLITKESGFDVVRRIPFTIQHFNVMDKCLLSHHKGLGKLFSINWGCIIMDEGTQYMNYTSLTCRGIVALYARFKWVLSGTLFNEPRPERIFGYFLLINDTTFPRNFPEALNYLSGVRFKGVLESCVYREKNLMFTEPPKLIEKVVENVVNDNEKRIYLTLKRFLRSIQLKIKELERNKFYTDREEYKRNLSKFSTYRLVLISYLRQCVICPVLPLASMALSAESCKDNQFISKCVNIELEKEGIKEWLDDTDSVKSSRITSILNELAEEDNNKLVIIFSCFKMSLLLLKHYLDIEGRDVFLMSSTQSSNKRNTLIQEFAKSGNGILLLTFDIGAEGLNLQFCNTLYIIDFWWNAGKTNQSIGRIYRFGQTSKDVFIKFFMSNTGIEEIIFKKQHAKQLIAKEIETGAIKTKIPKINMDELITFITSHDDEEKTISKIKHY